MPYWLTCGLALMAGYFLNILYITVFYHRGLTHGAVRLSPFMRKFVVATGSWVTGLDPKGWACMHRMHHEYSDTPNDPHSPVNEGIIGILTAQLKAYKRVLSGLIRGDEKYTTVVKDLDFPVNWLNRRKMWYLPYILHLSVALGVGFLFNAPLLGLCVYLGMMSHPVQGWLVNSFGHAVGYRNFDLPDNSRNNLIVAWLVMGEGFQNNHHKYPGSAKFSYKWWEVDLGFRLCVALQALGLLTIRKDELVLLRSRRAAARQSRRKATRETAA